MDSSFDIAVHVLLCMAHQNNFLSSEMLSRSVCTNPVRVRTVMGKLKKAGLVQTREGQDGGFRIAPGIDTSRLSLLQVAEAMDVKFVHCSWRSGDISHFSAVSSGMPGMMDQLYENLNEQCRLWLEPITIDQLHQQLSSQKKTQA